MTPDTLDGWTLEGIARLVDIGIFESGKFDFKEMLPRSADDGGKTRLRKTIAAFANGSGGFLVFGVRDDRALPLAERLVGVEPNIDLPQQFGAQPSVFPRRL